MRPERETKSYGVINPIGLEMVADGYRDKTLQPRDLLVLFALIKEVGVMTGQCWTNAHVAVQGMGHNMDAGSVSKGLKRLREADLVRRFYSPRHKQYWYAVNPRVVGFGTPDAQRKLWEKWQADKI